ncbi:TPR-like protein, partial [Parathielavia appendiculata]
MAQMVSTSFGPRNQGFQVGPNYGSINTEFHLPPERPESPPAPFAIIPFSRDPDFVNRGDILDQIDQRCSEPAARVALVGLGGVGKSQLAIEYAHRIAAGQPDTWVFWVHAGTQARVEEGFRTIADAVKLPGRNQPKANIRQLVYGWLCNERNGRWILVLDSADDAGVLYGPTGDDICNDRPFATYLPQSQNGSVMITTRDKDLAFRLTGRRHNMIEVGPMAQIDALTLLEKKLGLFPDTDVAADLLREGERKRSRLLEHDAGDLRRDGGASNAILTTWQISFKHVRSKRRSAADLLSLMSFFDRQGIPIWVLSRYGFFTRPTRARFSCIANSYIDDGTDNDIDGGFEDDIAMLRDYCLIAVDEAGDEFEMHGLVQLSTRRWLEAFGQQETFKQQYIERMAASFPTGEYENWATCRGLFAHVQVVLGYRPSGEMIETWAELLYNGGWYAWSQGRYDIAEPMLRKAEEACGKMLGKESLATLSCMSMFARVLNAQGRWEEAEKRFVQVMETFKTEFGVDHPCTLGIMGDLAATFLYQDRLEEAKKLLEQVLEASRIKLGVDHLDTLKSMANLATIYGKQYRWEEAEKLEVQVLEASKIKLGVDHPDTLRSMANLASTFLKQGRWEDAETLFVPVMETFKAKLGADHPDTLTSMANLAFIWKDQGRDTDALALMEACAKAQQRVLGPDHRDTRSSSAIVAKWRS